MLETSLRRIGKMITQVYEDNWLEYRMLNLGEAFSYASRECELDLDTFMSYFISSGYTKGYELQSPAIKYGLSGSELVHNILLRMNANIYIKTMDEKIDVVAFWCGYILAYYQHISQLSFAYIHQHLKMKDLEKMFFPLHEASEDKAVDVINDIIKKKFVTRLQERRQEVGLSQSQLAKLSGTNKRTLQEYETGAKDINKASAVTVYNLSRALYCDVSDILEFI